MATSTNKLVDSEALKRFKTNLDDRMFTPMNEKLDTLNKGEPDGVAPLNADGKVPTDNLPTDTILDGITSTLIEEKLGYKPEAEIKSYTHDQYEANKDTIPEGTLFILLDSETSGS